MINKEDNVILDSFLNKARKNRPVVIYFDISGSTRLEKHYPIFRYLKLQMKPNTVFIGFFSDKITSAVSIDTIPSLESLNLEASGGTIYSLPFNDVLGLSNKPSSVIIVTDGYGTDIFWDSAVTTKVLWILDNPHTNPTFGTVIRDLDESSNKFKVGDLLDTPNGKGIVYKIDGLNLHIYSNITGLFVYECTNKSLKVLNPDTKTNSKLILEILTDKLHSYTKDKPINLDDVTDIIELARLIETHHTLDDKFLNLINVCYGVIKVLNNEPYNPDLTHTTEFKEITSPELDKLITEEWDKTHKKEELNIGDRVCKDGDFGIVIRLLNKYQVIVKSDDGYSNAYKCEELTKVTKQEDDFDIFMAGELYVVFEGKLTLTKFEIDSSGISPSARCFNVNQIDDYIKELNTAKTLYNKLFGGK